MSVDVHGARLEGGPFDGDKGALVYDPDRPALPAELYCRACSIEKLPRRCSYCDGGACSGVHWWTERALAEKDPEATGAVEGYIYARTEEPREAIYVYGELTDLGVGMLAEDRTPATA